MTERTRKNTAAMTFDQKLDYFQVGETEFQYDGQTYRVRVMNPELQPKLPYFAGIPNGVLFISSAVPAEDREHIFRHEVVCQIQRSGQEGRCLQTTKEELSEILEDRLLGYLTRRREFYEALVNYLSDQGQSNPEITATYEYVVEQHQQIVVAGARAIASPHGLKAYILPPEIRSVGVQGDNRTYTDVIVLVGKNPGWEVIGKVSSEISSRLPINRVTYLLA